MYCVVGAQFEIIEHLPISCILENSRSQYFPSATTILKLKSHGGLLKQRIADCFVQEPGFMSLSYEGKLWTQSQHLAAGIWPTITEPVSQILDKLWRSDKYQDIVLIYRGQFIVSGSRIRSNERRLYNELLTELLALESWMHRSEYSRDPWTDGGADTHTNPAFGYVLERLRGIIMQCSNDDVANRNPSLLASYVRSV